MPEHLDKMYRFWQTILLNEHTYTGSPFAPHANMPIDAEHFDTWKAIFLRTVDELFSGEQARTIKWRAISMAEVFLAKIEYSRQNGLKSVQ
jgi:hemoglobin